MMPRICTVSSPSRPSWPFATMPSLRSFMLFSRAPWTDSGISSTSMHLAIRSAATGAVAEGKMDAAILREERRRSESSESRLGRRAS